MPQDETDELLCALQSAANIDPTDASDATSHTRSSHFQHALSKVQGHKWQELFDFDSILTHINHAEQLFLRGNCGSLTCSNNFAHQPATLNSPPRSPTTRCTRQMNQVQRLNGEDMHLFGIAPLQEAMSVVVCSHCSGTYTKMGLNNHMMLQHPEIWNCTSSKLTTSAEASALTANVQESARELASTKEAMPVEAVLSTPKSHASRTPKQKGKSKSGGGRSRSKTKHSHANNAADSAPTTPAKTETQPTKSSKSHNKKSAKANATALTKESTYAKDTVVPIVLYSSSSNSSCSLPATPKMSSAASNTAVEPISLDSLANAFAPTDLKEKPAPDSTPKTKSTTSSKKKSKGMSAAHIADVHATHVAASNEFERPTTSMSTHNKSSTHSASSRGLKGSKKRSAVVQPTTGKDSSAYEAQISELNQAVCSITNSLPSTADAAVMSTVIPQQQPQQQQQDTEHDMASAVSSFPNQMVAPMAASADEQLPPHNTSDDNSILMLEDMLDSKFIHEILSTAESDINFDETELEPNNQQNFVQQPANKRMRYEETPMMPVQQQVQQQVQQLMPGVITGEFTMYPQQTSEQEQHYAPYNNGNIVEDIKIYNNGGMPQVQTQYQHTMQQPDQQQSQLTTLDAMQLQQLLYQQPGYNASDMESATVAALQQQQQQDYASMCVTDGLSKSKDFAAVDDKLMEYATQQDNAYEQSLAAVAAAAQFNVFNVPSLTDELSAHASEALLSHVVSNSMPTNEAQQFVMPTASDGQVIYEINDNNQVSVMSQQRQQQVIAEFLTQAGYGAVENVAAAQPLVDSTNLQPKNTACAEFWDDGIDDFDYAKIETVKSLSSSSSSSSNASDSKALKQENVSNQHTNKHVDDFYNNVYLYSGIPRPLAVNNFGLVKMPHSAVTTFKKQLLASRKAYNNPFTLSGTAAGSMTANAARFTAANTVKIAQNYFTAQPQSTNEFLIGNITISNTPNATINTLAQQQLVKQEGGVEITINSNNTNRARQKGTLVVPAGVASAHNKAKFIPTSALSPAAALNTPVARIGGSTGVTTKSLNSTNFNSSAGDRVKFVKRPFLAKLDVVKHANAAFSAKKLNDIINGTNKPKSTAQHVFAVPQDPPQLSHAQQQSQQQFVDAMSQDIKNSDFMNEQMKKQRVQNFFERRQKLLTHTTPNTTNTATSNNGNTSAYVAGACGGNVSVSGVGNLAPQPQLLKQQLMRTLSDYGVNSIAQCKVTSASNNKPNNTSNNNDLMRVYV